MPASGSAATRRSQTKNYLIYVVLDTSESMRRSSQTKRIERTDLQYTQQGRFTQMISGLLYQLSHNTIINNSASVSVVAFNDRPQVLRPMVSLQQTAGIKAPDIGYGTNYSRVLRFLVNQHAKDVAAVRAASSRRDMELLIARPWVFFITDGLPGDRDHDEEPHEWQPYHRQLVDDPIAARVVAIGLPGAAEDTLWRLATGDGDGVRNALIAVNPDADPAQLAASVVQAIFHSISASVSVGTLTINVPAGMRRIDRRRGTTRRTAP